MALKCRPVLGEMPYLIKKQIVEFTEPLNRFKVRKLNRSFREIVDRSLIDYEQCYIHFRKYSVFFQINMEDKVLKLEYERGKVFGYKRGTVTTRTCFVERAALDLATFFQNKNALFEVFKVTHEVMNRARYTIDPVVLKSQKKFFSILKQQLLKFTNANTKLNIKSLDLCALNEEEMLSILPFVEHGPQDCDNLTLAVAPKNRMKQVIQLDVWKNAKILKLNKAVQFEVQSVAHIPKSHLLNCTFSNSSFKKLIEKLLQQTDFLQMDIENSFVNQKFLEEHLEKTYKKDYILQSTSSFDCHSIKFPNSEKYLKVKCVLGLITIRIVDKDDVPRN